MVRKFELINCNGESVSLFSEKLFATAPTGLGLNLDNVFSASDNYFIHTKSKVAQGNFQTTITFSQIKTATYSDFSDFASFLSHQPLTLKYITQTGTWYRDNLLKSISKGEASMAGLLSESFDIEFINPWYRHKSEESNAYNSDSDMQFFGKGYLTAYKNGSAYVYAEPEIKGAI